MKIPLFNILMSSSSHESSKWETVALKFPSSSSSSLSVSQYYILAGANFNRDTTSRNTVRWILKRRKGKNEFFIVYII